MRHFEKWILLFIVFIGYVGIAQPFPNPYRFPEDPTVTGGVGVTWIDGTTYTTFTLAPDIALGNFGVGLYLQFLFNNDDGFKFREDEYKGGAGILRAIRYLRYGQKYDPYYIRVGSLDRAILGNGFLMWNYNNQSNYDKRKIGLVADFDLGHIGFETVSSSVGTANLQGSNVYLRPLRFMENPPPVIQNLRFYFTLVRDNKVKDIPLTDTTFTRKDLSAFSIGADLPWLDFKRVRSSIYADYSKYKDWGDGQALGIQFIFPDFIGLFAIAARLEKRFLGEQFVPSFFGPLYELERNLGGDAGVFARLRSARKTEGVFGELAGHIIQKVQLIGNFQKLNGIKNSGILHVEANAPDLLPRIELRGYYDKRNIETFRDVRTLDINSILTGEVGYALNQYLLLSMVYRWYWVEKPGQPGTYEPLERIEPRLSFRYNF